MALMGHLRQFGDVGGMSAFPPIATGLVRGGERRKGRVARRNRTPGRSQIRA
jgi:hypothetical protein